MKEEKKAIEYLKRHIIPVYGRKGNIEYILNDVLLNLIDKQQKELEQEKEKNKELQDKCIELSTSIDALQTDLKEEKEIKWNILKKEVVK